MHPQILCKGSTNESHQAVQILTQMVKKHFMILLVHISMHRFLSLVGQSLTVPVDDIYISIYEIVNFMILLVHISIHRFLSLVGQSLTLRYLEALMLSYFIP